MLLFYDNRCFEGKAEVRLKTCLGSLKLKQVMESFIVTFTPLLFLQSHVNMCSLKGEYYSIAYKWVRASSILNTSTWTYLSCSMCC